MAFKMLGLVCSICLAFLTNAHAAREHRFFSAAELALSEAFLLCASGGPWMGGCAPQPLCKLDLLTQAALLHQTQKGSLGGHGVTWKHRMVISTRPMRWRNPRMLNLQLSSDQTAWGFCGHAPPAILIMV